MTSWLHRSLSPATIALATAGLVAVVALYCLAYSALLGRPESGVEVIAWALVNVAPWCLAFEAGKRAPWPAALGGGFLLSLLLGILWDGANDLAFEAARRVPAALLVGALLAIGRHVARSKASAGASEDAADLPLDPGQIEWVAAAGNYVEIRSAGRTRIERASLAAVERRLRRHGFVRIHRSTLVRRDRIARIRPSDVVLADGTSLKTGKRYRAGLVGFPSSSPAS